MRAKQIHEIDLLGTQVADFEERVDVERLRRERYERLQTELVKANLGGVLLFDPVNVRYATGTRLHESFAFRHKGRHALVPREGKPILFSATDRETHFLSDFLIGRPMHSIEAWTCGSFVMDATAKWARAIKEAMSELGIANEPLGIDRLDMITIRILEAEGVILEDGVVPLNWARSVKTKDELALIRQACAVADVALSAVRDAIKPGVTENELFSILTAVNIKYGGERIDAKLLAAGGNTNPWLHRDSSDRMVRPGDLVAMDTDMAGPLGYMADVSRTYLCGDGKPNDEQMESYKLAYEYIQKCIPLFTVGASFQEIAEKAPVVPDSYKANRYDCIAHGVGMSDEWPSIAFTDYSLSGFGNYPGELQENMVISTEASFGREGGREQVKLEEQLIVTVNGPEVISQAPYDWRFL